MDSLERIGKLLQGDEGRDAVHIAIVPAISKEQLHPNQRVGLVQWLGDKEMAIVSSSKMPRLGIVDPFLSYAVVPGEVFYVFLYPKTITSLRHVWTHPAFSEETSQ